MLLLQMESYGDMDWGKPWYSSCGLDAEKLHKACEGLPQETSQRKNNVVGRSTINSKFESIEG